MFDYNPNYKSCFTYSKVKELSPGINITVQYQDMGWLNNGVKSCEHPHKNSVDNSLFENRGTDIIYICDTCGMFWHVDMSD